MFGRLHIEERDRPERVVELSGAATIGRDADNDIILDSDGVSHCHAMLLAQPGGVDLIDLGSTFGTFVDAVEVPPDEPVRLVDGARISIGRVALRYYAAPRRSSGARSASIPQARIPPPLAIPHLNTRFDGVTADSPLHVGQRLALLIWVGAPLVVDERQSSRPLEWPGADLTNPVPLTVRVRPASSAWIVAAEQPTLLATQWGSAQVARYEIVARRPERTRLGISVEQAESHTLVQHFKLGIVAVSANGVPPAWPRASSPTAEDRRARCLQCGAATRPGARFCAQCGAQR